MKKYIALMFGVIQLSSSLMTARAQGEIIGEAVYTDITAYIDGLPVPSYNINGCTGIVAEDLNDYGFTVIWEPNERELSISYLPGIQVTAGYTPAENTKAVGSHAMDVYATDIRTVIAGHEVNSFNIGGKTVIYIDDLQYYGNITWSAEDRKICYAYEKPWEITVENDYTAGTSANIGGFSLDITKNENGGFAISGTNFGYLDNVRLTHSKGNGTQFGFSLYQRVLFQTEELFKLLWDMSMVKYNGEILQDNADIANEHMHVNINGEPATITKVSQGKGNGHTDFYFTLDTDIAKDEIKTIHIVCK